MPPESADPAVSAVSAVSAVPSAFVSSVAAMGAFALVPLLHWYVYLASAADRALLLPPVLGTLGSYGLGLGFWKLCPLERAWPASGLGRYVDYCGSHAVWHLAVAGAVALMDRACWLVASRPWDGSDCRA